MSVLGVEVAAALVADDGELVAVEDMPVLADGLARRAKQLGSNLSEAEAEADAVARAAFEKTMILAQSLPPTGTPS